MNVVRQTGWAKLSAGTEDDLAGIFRDAVRVMHAELADRDNTAGTGSPLASGHFSASMRIGVGQADTSVAPVDHAYKYPKPSVHQYNAYNLPAPTIKPASKASVNAALKPFSVGQTVFISNSSEYAAIIEDGRKGLDGSWQRPRGVFLHTLDELFKRQGWF